MTTRRTITIHVELDRAVQFWLDLGEPLAGYVVADEPVTLERALTASVDLVPGTRDELEVELDEATVEKLDMDAAEIEGAIEQAESAYWDLLASEPEQDHPDVLRGDYERDQRKEEDLPTLRDIVATGLGGSDRRSA